MMLAYRLVRLIETHSEELARGFRQQLQSCDRCQAFGALPAEEITQRVLEVYHSLGKWLLGMSERDIERQYCEIGRRRAQQGIPLSQVIWAIALSKSNLVDFLQSATSELEPVAIAGELEIVQLLGQFFDRAAYYAAKGYEQAWVGPAALTTAAR
jgi:hypothetical protein